MNSLPHTFDSLKQSGRTALIPFLTSGYPDQRTFASLLQTVLKAGADIVEIGIPFSDPLADGPTIQYSSHLALQNGTSLRGTLDQLTRMKHKVTVPLVIMSYLNPIRSHGVERFLKAAHMANVRGLIIPDTVIEESRPLEHSTARNDIDLIQLIAPTSTENRTAKILTKSRGFVYLVSVAGVTGSRMKLPTTLGRWIRTIKARTDLPVCVGFGISTPDQAAQVGRHADGVIIGSAIIEIIRQSKTKRQAVTNVATFIETTRKALDGR